MPGLRLYAMKEWHDVHRIASASVGVRINPIVAAGDSDEINEGIPRLMICGETYKRARCKCGVRCYNALYTYVTE